jgi:DNA/RNA-binding domain of Phe-tRNA-synthetase-like protein
VTLSVDPHPLLEPCAFTAVFPVPLAEAESPEWLVTLLSPDAPAPLERSEDVRSAVRDLLRHGGYKPTGRGKPASEYLVRAAGEGSLGSINAAVDACNVVSLHSGLPISVVDLDRAQAPFRIGLSGDGESYVFNASGQEIALSGLLCLHDARGPCANGVKDSQRTKTDDSTRRTLSVIWGTNALPGRAEAAGKWYRELLARLGAVTEEAAT